MKFNSKAAMNKAIELNGSTLDGRMLVIRSSSDRKPSQGGNRGGSRGRGGGFGGGRGGGGGGGFGGTPSKSSTLVVKNLSYNVSEDVLSGKFSGAVSVRIPKNRDTGESKG